MEPMIAYCGLVCTDCEAYHATQAGDRDALEQMAARAREEYGVSGATAESAQCDGCLSGGGRLCTYCFECAIRSCAMERGVANCAHCGEYGCARLEAFWAMAPKARTTLDGIHAGLVA
jgi:hypothetical protein